MTLKTPAEQAADDLAALYSTDLPWVRTVTYAGAEIPAIVNFDQDLKDETESAFARAEIMVRASDVAAPAYRDEVVIDSATWYVRRILSGDGLAWKLELISDERPLW